MARVLARQVQVARDQAAAAGAGPAGPGLLRDPQPACLDLAGARRSRAARGERGAVAGLGVWRGQTIKVWRDADGTLWRQGSVLTVVLWGVLIVARGLLYGVGVAVGHRDASDLGAVLVTLALSLAAQNTVTAMRMNAAPPLPAGQPGS